MAVIDKSYLQSEGSKFKQSTNTILRQNAFSLEYYEVFYSLQDAQEYATSNPLAYVGQKISVIDDTETKVYLILNEAGDLKEISGHQTTLSPEVIGDTDKILGVTDSGKLISEISLSWTAEDELSLLGRNGEVLGELPLSTVPEKYYYSPETEELVLGWNVPDTDNGGTKESTIKIPLANLIGEWTTEDTDTITLEKSRSIGDKDILKGIVNLYKPEDTDKLPNAIETIPGKGLYVPDLRGEDSGFRTFKDIADSIDAIKTAWTIRSAKSSDTLELSIDPDGVLKGDVKIDGETLVTGTKGIEANVDGVSLLYDEKTKKMSVGRVDGGTFG
jgi:hypothetical protein